MQPIVFKGGSFRNPFSNRPTEISDNSKRSTLYRHNESASGFMQQSCVCSRPRNYKHSISQQLFTVAPLRNAAHGFVRRNASIVQTNLRQPHTAALTMTVRYDATTRCANGGLVYVNECIQHGLPQRSMTSHDGNVIFCSARIIRCHSQNLTLPMNANQPLSTALLSALTQNPSSYSIYTVVHQFKRRKTMCPMCEPAMAFMPSGCSLQRPTDGIYADNRHTSSPCCCRHLDT